MIPTELQKDFDADLEMYSQDDRELYSVDQKLTWLEMWGTVKLESKRNSLDLTTWWIYWKFPGQYGSYIASASTIPRAIYTLLVEYKKEIHRQAMRMKV